MKQLITLLGVLVLTVAAVYLSTTQNTTLSSGFDIQEIQFQEWKMKFGKFYSTEENTYRLSVFKFNLNFINEYNQQNNGVTLSTNQFSGLTNEEFKVLVQNKQVIYENEIQEVTYQTQNSNNTKTDVPASVNWIQKGAVTDVKNQGTCGGCWAFAAGAGLEGLRQIEEDNLESLSVQQLIACDIQYGSGCDGGTAPGAYLYVSKSGIETWKTYPYEQESTSVVGACKYEQSETVYTVKGFQNGKSRDTEAMQEYVAKQPITIAIAASSMVFQSYNSGILKSDACGTNLDHAVTIVGYDTTGAEPYWIIKNSWGTSWGQKGYLQLLISDGAGVCGVNMQPTYPYN